MAIGNKGTLLGVCVTPQNSDLSNSAFEALTYVDVCCLTDVPALAETYSSLTAMCMDGTKITAVGSAEDTTADISVYYVSTCVGQDTIRDANGSGNDYAFKLTRSDATSGFTATTIYFRGKVTSKNLGSNGGVDEFTADTYTVTLTQGPILVKPTAI